MLECGTAGSRHTALSSDGSVSEERCEWSGLEEGRVVLGVVVLEEDGMVGWKFGWKDLAGAVAANQLVCQLQSECLQTQLAFGDLCEGVLGEDECICDGYIKKCTSYI